MLKINLTQYVLGGEKYLRIDLNDKKYIYLRKDSYNTIREESHVIIQLISANSYDFNFTDIISDITGLIPAPSGFFVLTNVDQLVADLLNF